MTKRFELAAPPTWIKPQRAKLADKTPDGIEWLHEIKLDAASDSPWRGK
jgi:hypothetical protein